MRTEIAIIRGRTYVLTFENPGYKVVMCAPAGLKCGWVDVGITASRPLALAMATAHAEARARSVAQEITECGWNGPSEADRYRAETQADDNRD